jgi:MOSC domain-containing protein YiiM
MPGILKKIWLKPSKLGPMDPAESAVLIAGEGIRGNANQRGKRQVTIIEEELWQEMMRELGAEVDPSSRRANLMVSGVSLRESRGKTLRIGECLIEIYGETRPCERMDEALPGLREAMQNGWRGGAFGVIVAGGEIKPGDPVYFHER